MVIDRCRGRDARKAARHDAGSLRSAAADDLAAALVHHVDGRRQLGAGGYRALLVRGHRGTEVFVAPTWDRGEPWLSTTRHVAKEGRCFVVGCCMPMRREDIPDRLSFKEKYLNAVQRWINPCESVIVDPDGKIVAGPVTRSLQAAVPFLQRASTYARLSREQATRSSGVISSQWGQA